MTDADLFGTDNAKMLQDVLSPEELENLRAEYLARDYPFTAAKNKQEAVRLFLEQVSEIALIKSQRRRRRAFAKILDLIEDGPNVLIAWTDQMLVQHYQEERGETIAQDRVILPALQVYLHWLFDHLPRQALLRLIYCLLRDHLLAIDEPPIGQTVGQFLHDFLQQRKILSSAEYQQMCQACSADIDRINATSSSHIAAARLEKILSAVSDREL